MATMIPSDIEDFNTKGERRFYEFLQAVAKPVLISDFLTRFQPPAKSSNQAINGYQLRPIVVVPASRGTGLASELVQTLLRDAARRGYSKIFLYTEAENIPANKFYTKFGFNFVNQESHSKQIYRRYEYKLAGVHEH